MENIIAVFNNRNQAMQFASLLKRIGVRSKVVNTPRELSVACGISIVFGKNAYGQAKMILSKLGLFSSVKMFIMTGDLFKKYLPIT